MRCCTTLSRIHEVVLILFPACSLYGLSLSHTHTLTLVGSMMPFSIMCTYSPVCALKPTSLVACFSSSPTMTLPCGPWMQRMAVKVRGQDRRG